MDMDRTYPKGYYLDPKHPALVRKNVREDRACKVCKHVRKVLVRYLPVGDKRSPFPEDTDERGNPRFLWRQEIAFAEVCTACQLRAQANHYMQQAHQHFQRAEEIERRRGERAAQATNKQKEVESD